MQVDEKLYLKMVEDCRLLEALRAAGVDNWSGYDDAIEILEQWEEENN